jgi:hypothetical protein
MIVLREHIDYLQRSDRPPEPLPRPSPQHGAPPSLRALSRIHTIGLDRRALEDPTQRARGPSSDLAMSLYAARISVAYLVLGRRNGIEVYLGNWDRGPTSAALEKAVGDRQEIITAGLRSLYPASDVAAVPAEAQSAINTWLLSLPTSGYVLGLPTISPSQWDPQVFPIDRIVRALRGSEWASMVLAEPVSPARLNRERDALIEELRDIPDGDDEKGDPRKPNVLGAYYRELLTTRLRTLSGSLGSGAWRTAVYLLGDASYYRLASIWQGVFTGEEGLLEPVRVWRTEARPFVEDWAMSDLQSPRGPGRIERLLEHQTLLSSAQLTAYLHLPHIEANGFKVKPVTTFGAAPQPLKAGETGVILGKVLTAEQLAKDQIGVEDYDDLPEIFYATPTRALGKHVFVAGVTGSGKTTTIFQMLKQAYLREISFLVIEPAKTEYRELLNHSEVGERLQIFTLGDELVSPLRMNPFEVRDGASVARHIDLLRALFSASFGLWTPLPQILETCLYQIYQDRGWDLANNVNPRLDNAPAAIRDFAFPTMSDLLAKVEEVTATLQWDPEATARIRGSLLDRLRSLVNGARGRMLDTQHSTPFEQLLSCPTVLELEPMGDDDDKAFMMGLLLIRLAEHRRDPRTRVGAGLQHLMVLEEAHRLLSNVKASGEQGAANPRAKAVETFSNMLAEIRSYGQGLIIADQVPVKLAPDVIKNTNVKVAHRIVDLEDRQLMAGAMAMGGGQMETLARLLPGMAAIYSEGDDAPLLVQVDPGKAKVTAPKPLDRELAARARESPSFEEARAAHHGCTDVGVTPGVACALAAQAVASPAFQRHLGRLVLSALDDPDAPGRLWAPLAAIVAPMQTADINAQVLTRCLIDRAATGFALRQGARRDWPYADTLELAGRLGDMLRAASAGADSSPARAFAERFRTLSRRASDPYLRCGRICTQAERLCLYRDAVADMVASRRYDRSWADAQPLTDGVGRTPQAATTVWWTCQNVADQLLEWTPPQADAVRRTGLCFAQMMLARDAANITPATQDLCFDRIWTASEAPLGR